LILHKTKLFRAASPLLIYQCPEAMYRKVYLH